MHTILIFLLFLTACAAHSWIACTKYTEEGGLVYDDSKCFGYPRNWETYNGGGFGNDRGYNYFTSNGGCDSNDRHFKFYSSRFYKATYFIGERVCLVWPSKNHVATTNPLPNGTACANPTNQFIGDRGIKLFRSSVNPTMDPTQSQFETNQITPFGNGVHVNGQVDFMGFQNCPNFCNNNDKSMCNGCFTVPNVTPGEYTFEWLWEFNQGEIYTTCFDADIVDLTAPTPAPTPMPPTTAPTGIPCTAQFECQVVSDDFNYVECVDGQCRCKETFFGSATEEDPCHCPGPVTWVDSEPMCMMATMPTPVAPTPAPSTPAPTTAAPTPAPTPAPTTAAPTPAPTPAPTTAAPTPAPTMAPTPAPTMAPTPAPTQTPAPTPSGQGSPCTIIPDCTCSTEDLNYVDCVSGQCRCKESFIGLATEASKCSCETDNVVWNFGQPICLRDNECLFDWNCPPRRCLSLGDGTKGTCF